MINPHLKQAIAKYHDIVTDVVYEGTKEECKAKEFVFRPSRLIGWNIAEGGGMPPDNKGKKWNPNRREKQLQTIKEKQSNFRTADQRRKGILTRKQNGYVEGKNLKPERIAGTIWWTNGQANRRSKLSPGDGWIEGRTKFQHYGETKICPHCGKGGRGSGMVRFHFENCKLRRIRYDDSYYG